MKTSPRELLQQHVSESNNSDHKRKLLLHKLFLWLQLDEDGAENSLSLSLSLFLSLSHPHTHTLSLSVSVQVFCHSAVQLKMRIFHRGGFSRMQNFSTIHHSEAFHWKVQLNRHYCLSRRSINLWKPIGISFSLSIFQKTSLKIFSSDWPPFTAPFFL